MRSALQKAEWRRLAPALLSRCRELAGDWPAVMVIRHSEVKYRRTEDIREAALTSIGRKAARAKCAPWVGQRVGKDYTSNWLRKAGLIDGDFVVQD